MLVGAEPKSCLYIKVTLTVSYQQYSTDTICACIHEIHQREKSATDISIIPLIFDL